VLAHFDAVPNSRSEFRDNERYLKRKRYIKKLEGRDPGVFFGVVVVVVV